MWNLLLRSCEIWRSCKENPGHVGHVKKLAFYSIWVAVETVEVDTVAADPVEVDTVEVDAVIQ